MHYEEFRDLLQESLREQGLYGHHVERPEETIDLLTTQRRWRAFCFASGSPRTEPFHVSASIGFGWSPIEAARSYTCEDDLLTELHGRKDRPTKTEPRYLRVDITLRAALPFGSNTAMPDPQILRPWLAAVEGKLDEFLRTQTKKRGGRIAAVLAHRGEVEAEARYGSGGILSLNALTLSAFRMVLVPRIWGDPEQQQAEKGAGEQLHQLARRFKGARDAWTASVGELATWIRYSPPPSEAASDDVSPRDGSDGGHPETTH